MKYCSYCETLLQKVVREQILFTCPLCQTQYDADEYDTLMFSETRGLSNSSEKYISFLENSPHANGSYKVDIKCRECGMPYTSLVRVGEEEITKLTCTCGAIYDYREYVKHK